MAPLAPVITQTVPLSPVPINTVVATIAQPPEEVDPGPFTYALTTDAGGAFTSTGTDISTTAETVAGSYGVGVIATTAGGGSPEGTATLAFADEVSPPDPADDSEYAGNPQFPPASDEAWTLYIAQATHTIMPRALEDTDYVVGRTAVTDPISSLYWNDAVLGARPDAEIEALARELAGPAAPITRAAHLETLGQPAPALPPRPDIALYAPMNPGDAAL